MRAIKAVVLAGKDENTDNTTTPTLCLHVVRIELALGVNRDFRFHRLTFVYHGKGGGYDISKFVKCGLTLEFMKSTSKTYLPLIASGNMDFMMNANIFTHASITDG